MLSRHYSVLFKGCHEQLVNSNPIICIVVSLGIVTIPLTCREVNRITRNFKQWRCKTLCRVEWELPSFWQMNFRCVHKVTRFVSWSISVKENSSVKAEDLVSLHMSRVHLHLSCLLEARTNRQVIWYCESSIALQMSKQLALQNLLSCPNNAKEKCIHC